MMAKRMGSVRRMGHGAPKWNEAAYRKQKKLKDEWHIQENMPWYANQQKYWAEMSTVAVLLVIPITYFPAMTEGLFFNPPN